LLRVVAFDDPAAMQATSPLQVLEQWVMYFNQGDVAKIVELYTDDASIQPVFAEPTVGREAIRAMFKAYFSAAKLECNVIDQFASEDGKVTLEWRDTVGLRGCNVYQIRAGKIATQRSYFDQLSFCKLNGIPVPEL